MTYLYTETQAAKRLRCSVSYLRNLVRCGQLRIRGDGMFYRKHISELRKHKYLRAQQALKKINIPCRALDQL